MEHYFHPAKLMAPPAACTSRSMFALLVYLCNINPPQPLPVKLLVLSSTIGAAGRASTFCNERRPTATLLRACCSFLPVCQVVVLRDTNKYK